MDNPGISLQTLTILFSPIQNMFIITWTAVQNASTVPQE